MKITISNNGVNFEIEGDEILKALFSENNKALYELKKALDKLEAHELAEPSNDDIRNIPFFSDEEIEQMLSQTNEGVKTFIIEEKPQNDTEVPPTPKEPVKSIENKPKRKYHRRHKHNKKKVKPVRGYSVSPKNKKVTFVGNKPNHLTNDEDTYSIPPARRPKTNNIEVNI